MSKIDRLGKCPNCGRNWDDGDILKNLNGMAVFAHTTPRAMTNIAKSLGYSEENKTKFSAVNVYQFDGNTVYECPSMICRHIFVVSTGEEYPSLFEFKQSLRKEATDE